MEIHPERLFSDHSLKLSQGTCTDHIPFISPGPFILDNPVKGEISRGGDPPFLPLDLDHGVSIEVYVCIFITLVRSRVKEDIDGVLTGFHGKW